MATLVATQLDALKLERARRRQERSFGLLLVSGLTLLALAVHGYHPYAEDGGLYMAGVKRLLDPTLYPHGTAFVLEPMRWSLFAPSVAWLVRACGAGVDRELHRTLPAVLLVLYLASVWATLFAAWMLAERCWPAGRWGREVRAGAVVLLACWLDLPVAGTALLLMDPYLTARSFSTPLMVLALVAALDMTALDGTGAAARRRGLVVWAGSLVLAAAMHPLMAGYALWGSLLLICLRSARREMQAWGTAGLCVGALALAAVVHALAQPESAVYVRAAMTRTYWFLAEWRWYELTGLAAPLAILAWAAWNRTAARSSSGVNADARTALARMALAAGATAVAVALLLARAGAETHLVARLQPLRVFQIVYLAMILVLGAKLGEALLRHTVWRWAAAVVLLSGPLMFAARAASPDSPHLELPWTPARNPWVRAFVWVRENTPKDALFALDADYINARNAEGHSEDAQCFRAVAERSALPDYSKDGGEASIAPSLTEAWAAGQVAQRGLSAPAETDAERVAALTPLGVSWMVLKTSAKTALDCPYRNGAVEVCRLR